MWVPLVSLVALFGWICLVVYVLGFRVKPKPTWSGLACPSCGLDLIVTTATEMEPVHHPSGMATRFTCGCGRVSIWTFEGGTAHCVSS